MANMIVQVSYLLSYMLVWSDWIEGKEESRGELDENWVPIRPYGLIG